MNKQVIAASLFATVIAGCVYGDNRNNANHLIRVDEEPAGANCEFGGVVIKAGIDKNHNEVLEDDEIKSSHVVCNGETSISCRAGTTHDGSVTISAANEFAQLSGVTCVDGDLIITGTDVAAIPELSSLETVTGAVIVAGNPQLTSLDGLDGLREIGLTYLIQGNGALSDVSSVASLDRVPDVVIVGNDGLVDLAGLSSLTELAFELSVTNNASLTSLHGLEGITQATGLRVRANPQLSTVAALENIRSISLLELSGNQILGTIDLPNLARMDVRLMINNSPALTSIRFDSLATVGDAIHLVTDPALVSASFPSLLSTGIFNVTGATSLTTLSVPELAFAASNIELSSVPALASPDFGSLTQIGGYLLLRDAAQLTTLDGFANLTAVHNNMWVINTGIVSFQGLALFENVAGDLSITNNRQLVGFDGLGAMTEVGGNLLISNNAALSLPVAQAFASQLDVGGQVTIN